MRSRPIVTDDTKQEITNYIDDFPFSTDRQLVSQKDIAGIPHWHYEIQISVVTSGSVIFRTPGGDFYLEKGQGIFVNSGVLHEIISTSDENSEYICINFDPHMLCGQSEKLIQKKYIDPLLACKELEELYLGKEEWQKKICCLAYKVGKLSDKESFGSELSIKVLLFRIWEIITLHNQDYLTRENAINQVERERQDIFLEYIHSNYMHHVMLGDIAQAANVSRGECCRLFKRAQNMSPMTYMAKYRIRQSIKLLACTSLSVAEIAEQTGFKTSSYFTECFKKETGLTPVKYRNIYYHIDEQR
jgi:AraC-like DNA-binding protein/mannose-6-phosphate isomerase-like protein (cupin superfamily)